MSDLAQITLETIGYIAAGTVGVAAIVAGLAASYRSFCKKETRYKQILDQLKDCDLNKLERDELVNLYNIALSINDYKFLGERHEELRDVFNRLHRQLQPIIKDEIRPEDIIPGASLEDLSQTHRETIARYRR